jgi:hypothetical protein
MEITWVQDKTGVNTLHRTGCAHLRMADNGTSLDFCDSIEAAMQYVVDDNVGGLGDGEALADWVHVSPCLR